MYNITARVPKDFILLILIWQIGIFSIHSTPIFGEYADAVKHDTQMTGGSSPKSDTGPSISDWDSLESNYFAIYYKNAVSLKKVEANLRKRVFYFNPTAKGLDITIEERLSSRLDTLLNRVKELLDMQPIMPKLKLRIFKNRGELNDEYFRIFNTRGNCPSFYVYKYNTIYTSEADISDSILAHEMAHAVIDHYFTVIPPRGVAEVLASYVDIHLEE